jgi:hypothetical protein
MQQLRNFISNIISEGMLNPNSSVILQDYALYAADDSSHSSNAGVKVYILYNKREIYERLSDRDTIIDMFRPLIMKSATGTISISDDHNAPNGVKNYFMELVYEHTYAVIQTKKNREPCNAAVQVVRAAAKEGHGPTLYDIVMSVEPNGITPDRAQVSASAREVYRFYAEKRPEIEINYLDGGNITDIATDDCDTYMTPQENTKNSLLRKAYYEAFGDWLISHNREFYQTLDNRGGFIDVVDHFGGPDDVIRYMIDSREFNEMFDEGELSELQISWYEAKEKIEKNLYKLKPPAILEPKEELNLSYNTDYAINAFKTLTASHDKFLENIEQGMYHEVLDIYDGKEVMTDGLFTKWTPAAWQTLLLDFFHEKYTGG